MWSREWRRDGLHLEAFDWSRTELALCSLDFSSLPSSWSIGLPFPVDLQIPNNILHSWTRSSAQSVRRILKYRWLFLTVSAIEFTSTWLYTQPASQFEGNSDDWFEGTQRAWIVSRNECSSLWLPLFPCGWLWCGELPPTNLVCLLLIFLSHWRISKWMPSSPPFSARVSNHHHQLRIKLWSLIPFLFFF